MFKYYEILSCVFPKWCVESNPVKFVKQQIGLGADIKITKTHSSSEREQRDIILFENPYNLILLEKTKLLNEWNCRAEIQGLNHSIALMTGVVLLKPVQRLSVARKNVMRNGVIQRLFTRCWPRNL